MFSIHASNGTCKMFLMPLTATVLPLKSFAVRIGELTATITAYAGDAAVCTAAGAMYEIGMPWLCADAIDTASVKNLKRIAAGEVRLLRRQRSDRRVPR